MSAAGPNASGTQADDSAVGTLTWSSPSSAVSSNNGYATAGHSTASTVRQTHYLKVTNFGFAIPSGATINGVTVAVERMASETGLSFTVDAVLSLVKGGTVSGNNKADTSTHWSAEKTISYGGAADLWGLTLTDTDVNATTFGVVLSANVSRKASGKGSSTASVDFISITIDYTTGGGGGLSIPVAMSSYRRRRV